MVLQFLDESGISLLPGSLQGIRKVAFPFFLAGLGADEYIGTFGIAFQNGFNQRRVPGAIRDVRVRAILE